MFLLLINIHTVTYLHSTQSIKAYSQNLTKITNYSKKHNTYKYKTTYTHTSLPYVNTDLIQSSTAVAYTSMTGFNV